ncbi:MAG: phosphatase PAP2 family protein [Elusimicrobia bacterium]|nr:phosphatase PAP2 family protein [Elusimicrobiota bacterium]
MAPQLEALEREIARLEAKFRESTDELTRLRKRFKLAAAVAEEVDEIKDEWHSVHYKWWIIVLSGVLTFFVVSYFYYSQVGYYADQRHLPHSSDWLLRRLPEANLLPLLSYGWLALHLYAAAVAILYYPRQLPFMIFTLGLFMIVRTTFMALSPIGPPHGMLDMSKLDYVFSRAMGVVTFQNEFVVSGHTSFPFLFYLFFDTPWQKRIFLTGSVVMAIAVLVTRNHYTVDVLSAYLISYSVYCLSRKLYYSHIRPLYIDLSAELRKLTQDG